MAKRYDLVIVGAGPGGAMAAKTEILEKKEFDLVLI
jgi:flavin-dependent dehydrogenase